MNLTALALLTLATAPAQPPADLLPIRDRTLKLDIEYKPEQRKNIAQVQLVVSDNRGQSYQVWDAVTADKDHLVFRARDDGEYWVNMIIRFRDGTQDPGDPSRVPPAMKLLVDATAPVVRITSAQRIGEEIVVEWAVEEKYPGKSAASVRFKPAGPDVLQHWQTVAVPAPGQQTVRFNPGVTGPVTVEVSATDLAGNTGSSTQDVGTGVTTSYLSAGGPPSAPVMPSPVEETRPAASGVAAPTSPIPPPSLPPPSSSTATPAGAGNTSWAPGGSQPLPVTSGTTDPKPIPVFTGSNPPAPTPPAAAERSNVEFVRTARFDIQYQVEKGPSGISRIDLYVTRDDGRTWTRWSQHDGREMPLKVKLDLPFNTRREGEYGFRLVPVSGVGLTADAPSPGTPPDLRIHLDETPPLILPFQPTADPTRPNSLVLHWQASDQNFGRDPIAIEWSDHPTGPWKPVAGGDAIVPVGEGIAGQPNRLPNTGSHAWQLPTNMATHRVYLKFAAWDAAGNKSEVVTQSPILVDLVKPRATIQGVSTGSAPRQ